MHHRTESHDWRETTKRKHDKEPTDNKCLWLSATFRHPRRQGLNEPALHTRLETSSAAQDASNQGTYRASDQKTRHSQGSQPASLSSKSMRMLLSGPVIAISPCQGRHPPVPFKRSGHPPSPHHTITIYRPVKERHPPSLPSRACGYHHHTKLSRYITLFRTPPPLSLSSRACAQHHHTTPR